MTNHTKNNNLNDFIDPMFIVSQFENENDRKFFSKYYIANVEVEDFRVLIQQGNTKTKKHLQIATPLKLLQFLQNFRNEFDQP